MPSGHLGVYAAARTFSIARYADQASDQVERFSGHLRETSVEEITDEVRGFARRRPGLFLGSAALLGFLGTRFLKSSSQGASAGGHPDGGYGAGISSAMVSHGTGEPATALPPGTAAGSPTAEPPAVGGRTEPPRGF